MNVQPAFIYAFEFTDKELGLVLRALGLLSGVDVSPKRADVEAARDLNGRMLKQMQHLHLAQTDVIGAKLRRFAELLVETPLPEQDDHLLGEGRR